VTIEESDFSSTCNDTSAVIFSLVTVVRHSQAAMADANAKSLLRQLAQHSL
jgi:hypothetical protein